MKSAIQIAEDALASSQCVCGKKKTVGNPLCLRCFYKLEPKTRFAMGRTFSEGFAIYYGDAVDYLKQEGIVKS